MLIQETTQYVMKLLTAEYNNITNDRCYVQTK